MPWYDVTFPSGHKVTRRSTRTYSHCWLVVYVRTPEAVARAIARASYLKADELAEEVITRKGFAANEFLAKKALAGHLPDIDFYTIKYQGVVPTGLDSPRTLGG